MKKHVVAFLWCVLASVGCVTQAVGKPLIVAADSPELFKELHPPLRNAVFTSRSWEGTLRVPLFGTQRVVLPYFEMDRTAEEMGNDAYGSNANTTIRSRGDGTVEILVVTCKKPSEQVLADEAVNAFFPWWLFEWGIDAWKVFRNNSTAPYRFTWGGKSWTLDQLSEALSFIVSGQMVPGGYAGWQAKSLCVRLPKFVGKVGGENRYEMTNALASQTKCDFPRMFDHAGEALKALIETLPKVPFQSGLAGTP